MCEPTNADLVAAAPGAFEYQRRSAAVAWSSVTALS
jgi:hypothetical protein